MLIPEIVKSHGCLVMSAVNFTELLLYMTLVDQTLSYPIVGLMSVMMKLVGQVQRIYPKTCVSQRQHRKTKIVSNNVVAVKSNSPYILKIRSINYKCDEVNVEVCDVLLLYDYSNYIWNKFNLNVKEYVNYVKPHVADISDQSLPIKSTVKTNGWMIKPIKLSFEMLRGTRQSVLASNNLEKSGSCRVSSCRVSSRSAIFHYG
jgi:hypothetical protein